MNPFITTEVCGRAEDICLKHSKPPKTTQLCTIVTFHGSCTERLNYNEVIYSQRSSSTNAEGQNNSKALSNNITVY